MNNKKISWKYYNPWEKLEEEELEDDDTPEFLKNEKEENTFVFAKIQESMPTPLGVIDTSRKNPFYDFTFYIADTNFPLEKPTQFNGGSEDVILGVQGVEICRVMTKYRFFVCIGKLFDVTQVKKSIESTLCGEKMDNNVSKEINDLTKTLSNQYKHWGVYVFPNGEKYVIYSNEDNETYKKDINTLEQLKKLSGGLLIKSDE